MATRNEVLLLHNYRRHVKCEIEIIDLRYLVISAKQCQRFTEQAVWKVPLLRDANDADWAICDAAAGIDLALAWVEEDCGAGLAHEAAHELVLFLRSPDGQPQSSVSLASQASDGDD